MQSAVIALDQGTTSSRAIVFSPAGDILGLAQVPLTQHYPQPGWVEHDPREILSTQFSSLRDAFAQSGLAPGDIAALGITNQRETVIVWDKDTGEPIMNAVVWQCRRTAEECRRLEQSGIGDYVRKTTGLLIDAYFSGTKISWILDHVPQARARAEAGKLLCGTVDSWLIWNLTGEHVSDYSNCARTMLFDIDRLCWDEELCRALRVPMHILPRPVPNSGIYGRIRPGIPGLEALAGIPVCGAAGDQQAALFGQGCFDPGQAKNTYGTGCFTLMNTGERPIFSENGLVTTIAWGIDGTVTYALEGSVFVAGAAIQWLRDEMRLIDSAEDSEYMARKVPDTNGCYVVPAFTGLGAPHWDQYARGTIVGITRGVNKYHIIRATLESLAYQVQDVLTAMKADSGIELSALKVDGGASANNFLMQTQADMITVPVERPKCVETTAMGAAYLAGLAVGYWDSMDEIRKTRAVDRVFTPMLAEEMRQKKLRGWERAVKYAYGWAREE